MDELREVSAQKLDAIVQEAVEAGDIYQVYIKDNYPRILFYNWHPQYKAVDSGTETSSDRKPGFLLF
jgi:hypothetical protein